MLDERDIGIFKEVIKDSENSILKELDRAQDSLQKQIDDLKKEVKAGSQAGILLNIIDDLRRRVEELEKRTA